MLLLVHMSMYQPLTSSHRRRSEHTMNQLRRRLLTIELEDKQSRRTLYFHSSIPLVLVNRRLPTDNETVMLKKEIISIMPQLFYKLNSLCFE